MRVDRTTIATIVGAGALLAGGGTAFAQGDTAQRGERCEARLASAAERMGISAAELETQVKAKLTARVDAALAAGKIRPERAAKLKERIASWKPCAGAAAAKLKLRPHGMIGAAAAFLDLSKAELRAQLPGTSLAALATKQGKSVADLKAAMLAPAKARLAKRVESGRKSQERADKQLARLTKLVDRLVVKTFPAG